MNAKSYTVEMLNENTAHSRNGELKDVVDSLFEQHDNSHLDEEVCQTTTWMALQPKQNTSKGQYCSADMMLERLKKNSVNLLTSSSLHSAMRT